MTDEQIAAAYRKSSGIDISRVPNGIAMARAFIEAVFDALPIADTTPDFEPLYRRPD